MKHDANSLVKQFFANYPQHTVKRNTVLFEVGEEPGGVYYLESGEVGSMVPGNTTDLIVNVYIHGTYFPMNWAMNRRRNDFTFRALTDVTYRLAPADDVLAFLNANPTITYDLLSRVFIGTDGMLHRMALLMGANAHSRILFELSIAAKRHGNVSPSGEVVIQITESGLAQRSGLTRETVNRELKRLREDDLISVGHGVIKIHDFLELEKLAAKRNVG